MKIDQRIICWILYQIDKKNKIINLTHTYTDTLYRGLELANTVTIWAFNWAEENGYQVKGTCPYISETFLEMNPSY